MKPLITTVIEKILYLPPKSRYSSYHSRFNNNYHEFLIDEGKIAYYHFDRKMPITLLYMHGNAEDLFSTASYLHWLSYSFKVDIISFDYPGYGQTSGTANEKDIKKYAELFINYVVNTLQIDPKDIILYGHSLGTAVAAYVAYWLTKNNLPPAGLILQSAFTSVYEIAFEFRIPMKHDMFRTIDIIDKIECPITLIHGINDFLIPKVHSQRLYMKIQPQYRYDLLFVENAGHNNIEARCFPRELYFGHINNFFERTKIQHYYSYYYTKYQYKAMNNTNVLETDYQEYIYVDKKYKESHSLNNDSIDSYEDRTSIPRFSFSKRKSLLRMSSKHDTNLDPLIQESSSTKQSQSSNSLKGINLNLSKNQNDSLDNDRSSSTLLDTPEVHLQPEEYMRNEDIDKDNRTSKRDSLLDTLKLKIFKSKNESLKENLINK